MYSRNNNRTPSQRYVVEFPDQVSCDTFAKTVLTKAGYNWHHIRGHNLTYSDKIIRGYDIGSVAIVLMFLEITKKDLHPTGLSRAESFQASRFTIEIEAYKDIINDYGQMIQESAKQNATHTISPKLVRKTIEDLDGKILN